MILLLVGVFGLALLGLTCAFACWLVLRFSLPEPHGPILALIAWAAVLAGTCGFIIRIVETYVSTL